MKILQEKNLSDMELMKKIAAYPASFDYGASHSGYVSMIIYGNGDQVGRVHLPLSELVSYSELMPIQKREQGLRRRKRSHECNGIL